MIDSPGYAGQSILNSFIFDSSPQRASSHARDALLWIDDRIVEIAREVDYEAVFGRRGTRRAMTAATDRNLEVVLPSVLQREGNVANIFDEGDNTSIALRVGGPAGYGLCVSVVVGGHDIPFQRLLELGETRHPAGRHELTRQSGSDVLYIHEKHTGRSNIRGLSIRILVKVETRTL
jgi:hypothetical protein